jgi:hypothetical protein
MLLYRWEFGRLLGGWGCRYGIEGWYKYIDFGCESNAFWEANAVCFR